MTGSTKGALIGIFILLNLVLYLDNISGLQTRAYVSSNESNNIDTGTEILEMTELRGSIQSSSIDAHFGWFKAENIQSFNILNTQKFKIDNYARFEINTSEEFFNISHSEAENISIISNGLFILESFKVPNNFTITPLRNLEQLRAFRSGNSNQIQFLNGFYSMNFYSDIEVSLHTSTQMNITYSTNTGIQIVNGEAFDILFYGRSNISFNGTIDLHLKYNDDSSFVIRRQAGVARDLFDYTDPSIIKLTETSGNFGVGSDDYSTNGFDEVLLINSYTTVMNLNDLAIQVALNYSETERPFNLSFGYVHIRALISQLLINEEVMYQAGLTFQQTPSLEITLDETREKDIEITFVMYNPTAFDIMNLHIDPTEGLSNIFSVNITIGDQPSMYFSPSPLGFQISFLRSIGLTNPPEMTICKFKTNYNSFNGKQRVEGDIVFSSDNSENISFPLVVNHTSLIIEVIKMITSPYLFILSISGVVFSLLKREKVQDWLYNKRNQILPLFFHVTISLVILCCFSCLIITFRIMIPFLSSFLLLLLLLFFWILYICLYLYKSAFSNKFRTNS